MRLVGILLLVLLIVVVSLTLILGIAIGIGWVLTLFFPFSLFEGSLLGILASIIVGSFWMRFITSFPALGLGDYDEDDFDLEDFEEEYDQIPPSRFYRTRADQTWETWIRYQIANDIYMAFQDSPHPVAPIGRRQLQELAIRLADITVSLLKTKSTRVNKLEITPPALKKQMGKIGQRPYDDDILSLAATAINEDLIYHYSDIMRIIRGKLWNQPADMFD